MSDTKGRDVIFHILYTDDMETTLELCKGAVERVATETREMDAVRLYEIAKLSPHMARCVFILLLNMDMALKEAVCKPLMHRASGVNLQPLCPHKAQVFFKELSARVVPRFLRDELMLSVDFELQVQEIYQCS